jgi:hypothetical protein
VTATAQAPAAPVRAAGGRGLEGLGRRARRLGVAASVLACAVMGALSVASVPELIGNLATRPTLATAKLATATCADWQAAGGGRRAAIVDALGVAATAPDPENGGATLARGEGYALLSRACSTRLSRSFLLFEVYNRAASFTAPAASPAPAMGGFGNGPRD